MATDSEFYPKDDHSWKTWMFQEYLQVRGPLTEENVMEYFEESFLFDRSSNNNVLRMQTQHADPNYRMSRLETENELRRFTGLEYALVHAQPPLFVIQRRDRLSPTEVRPTAVYFILNNVLYSGPDLYTLLATKLTNSLNMIQSSLDILRAARPDYTPRIGHVWPIVDVPSASSKLLAGKARNDTRQGSVVPGTPAAAGAGADTNNPSSQLPKQPQPDAINRTLEENEDKQIWEPFAFAFHGTRMEMERRRIQAMQTLAATAGTGSSSGPGGPTSNAAHNAMQQASNARGVGGGGMRGADNTTGRVAGNDAGVGGVGADADDASRRGRSTGGEHFRRSSAMQFSSSATSQQDGSLPSSSARPALSVPTADAPKLKNTPGPPGKPGHGKKKQRRIEKQALKQGSAQTPVPATPV